MTARKQKAPLAQRTRAERVAIGNAGLSEDAAVLAVRPIGIIHTRMLTKFEAPHQPDQTGQDLATIELNADCDFEQALHSLEGFDRIWLIWWFHKNDTWRPKIIPPRGDETKRGVFATRSPHRPNPIGISVVRLVNISGRQVTIGSCDLLDGTPILDIKPYVPSCDAFPDSRIGWLADVEASYAAPPRFRVRMSKRATEQLEWLKANQINFIERAVELLQRDPSENRARRIKECGDNLFRMGCAEWRIFYSLHENEVVIEFFRPGYVVRTLLDPGHEVIPNRDTQLGFLNRWPELSELSGSV